MLSSLLSGHRSRTRNYVYKHEEENRYIYAACLWQTHEGVIKGLAMTDDDEVMIWWWRGDEEEIKGDGTVMTGDYRWWLMMTAVCFCSAGAAGSELPARGDHHARPGRLHGGPDRHPHLLRVRQPIGALLQVSLPSRGVMLLRFKEWLIRKIHVLTRELHVLTRKIHVSTRKIHEITRKIRGLTSRFMDWLRRFMDWQERFMDLLGRFKY